MASLAPACAAAQANPPPSVELIAGILFDAARGLLVAPAEPRGIAAFEAATGKVVWRDSAAERPLALDGRRLVATLSSPIARELRVVVLDARDGSLIKEMPTVPFPPEVPPQSYLALQTRIQGDVASVRWTARPEVLRARPPLKSEVPKPDPRGVLTFQLSEGRLLPRIEQSVSPAPDSRAATLEWTLVNGVEASIEQQVGRATLKRRRKKQALPDVVLAEGFAASAAFSEDRRHVLGTFRIERPIRPDLGELYSTAIFEAATGKRLASGRLEGSPGPFLFVGGKLVYFHGGPDEIRAVDLTAGRTAYTRRVRLFHQQAPG